MNGLHRWNLRRVHTTVRALTRKIDYSLVPTLNEKEIEEQFIAGSGPGGSNVAKNSNCALLRHIPTGIVVKCHESRLLETNRKLAREKLITKLDNMINGENSVEHQVKLSKEKKGSAADWKKKKLREMKETWKSREGIE